MLRSVARWLHDAITHRSEQRPRVTEMPCEESHRRADSILAPAPSASDTLRLEPQLRLGDAANDAGAWQDALEVYEDCLILQPDCVPAHLGQARAYRALGCHADSAASYQLALVHSPVNETALVEYAGLLGELGNWSGASEQWRLAASLPSRSPDSLRCWADALRRTGQSPEAEATYQRSIDLEPSNVPAYVNWGLMLLEDKGDPAAAASLFRQALDIEPERHEARANLGLALHEMGRYDEAAALYEEALRLAPHFVEFRWNRALLHLAQGSYAQGWLDYETRFQRDGGRSVRAFPFPMWRGEHLDERKLLVFAEQGVGDEIMFGSCVPDLVDRSIRVVLECSPRLEGLFARSFPEVLVHGAERNGDRSWLRTCDGIGAQIPIGSLPLYLRSKADSFLRRERYLQADSASVSRFRSELSKLGPGLKVGVAWRGGTLGTRSRLRSVSLAQLTSLFLVPGVHFVSLQHQTDAAEQALLARQGVHEVELGDDLDRRAAFIEALDLVITVDNTNAHLAGAMGKPCWVLLGACPEWRWRNTGDATPWYRSVRLFRSADDGWLGVLGRVVAALTIRAQP